MNDLREARAAIAKVSARARHGWRDIHRDPAQLERMMRRKQIISVGCGTISRLALRELKRRNIQGRHAYMFAKKKTRVGDDSHTMIEAKIGGRWQAFDPDMGVQMLTAGAKRRGLSAKRLTRARNWDYQRLARQRRPDFQSAPEGFGPYYRREWAKGMKPWHRRMFGTVVTGP